MISLLFRILKTAPCGSREKLAMSRELNFRVLGAQKW
jgi:hypothetical protein